ncbi:MAG: replication initiator protein A [Candidatus Aminicenantes bacterium]|nr:replication initiator protein A [Candidatus Aminicenantes bacterium]
MEKDKYEIQVQFKPLTISPLPPKTKKVEIIEGKHKTEGFKPVWEKTTGDYKVKIVADPEYGFPYGRDILVILWLIKAAMEQNQGGIIKFSKLENYLDTFNIDSGGKSYAPAINSFKRIFYSTWFWEDKRDENNKAFSFRIIKSWNVYFDEEKGTNPLFDSYIELSQEFWSLVKRYPIPYDLSMVIKLKHSPAALNLYLFLVFRTYVNWEVEKEEKFIPLFGETGLKNQLSSDTKDNYKFKQNFMKWIDEIKAVWDNAPFYFKVETNPKKKGRKGNKIFKDGLFIHVENVDELHIKPHWQKKLRLAAEEAEKKILSESTGKACEKCGKELELRMGKTDKRGIKMDDYWFCNSCRTPYYKYKYPEMY